MLSAKTETGEVLNRGLAIYERYIAPRLNVEDEGRYVAVDMNSGKWEIADTREATEILRARVPDADIFLLKHIDLNQTFRWAPEGLMRRLGIPDGMDWFWDEGR